MRYQKYHNRYHGDHPQIKQLDHFTEFLIIGLTQKKDGIATKVTVACLKRGMGQHQGNCAIVRQVMVIIYEVTGMAITYFTQSAKENENLLLIQDFVTWLVLWYNLVVKIIQSDNEINCIKTKKQCNNFGISFEPYTPDTHVQNGEAERFGWLIMEKARIMRLLANLPHKLWRKIVAGATYLYNRTPQCNDLVT